MNKEDAIVEFLKGLRIVLSNASAYKKDHPYFIKSAEVFKQKLDNLFLFLDPVRINIAPHHLVIDGINWEKQVIYQELAQIFHLRKIKSVEFKQGLNTEELLVFLGAISMSIRDILRSGGIRAIIHQAASSNLLVEELDYSDLLKDSGDEVKDVWVFLLREAVRKEDPDKIRDFADNFERIIKKIKAKELTEDTQLRESIVDFLNFLKSRDKQRYDRCVVYLMKLMVREKEVLNKADLVQIQPFFNSLNKDDLCQTILDEMLEDEHFDQESISVFSHLINDDLNKEIAPVLKNKIQNNQSLINNPILRKKIKELFLSSQDLIAPFYRQVFDGVVFDNISTDKDFTFDKQLMHINYIFILLNFFLKENQKEELELVVNCLAEESKNIVKNNNIKFLKLILDILNKRIKEYPSLAVALQNLEKLIFGIVEKLTFEDGLPDMLELLDSIKASSLGQLYHIKRIFQEGKVNVNIMRLYLRLFAHDLDNFYQYLEDYREDVNLLSKISNSLSDIDSLVSLDMLKKIFCLAPSIIKGEIVRGMTKMSRQDYDFLHDLLKGEEVFLKKEALAILVKNQAERKLALDVLLGIPSPFGSKNNILLKNLSIVEEICLKESLDYLLIFSKKQFFWNNNIRVKAKKLLNKLNDG